VGAEEVDAGSPSRRLSSSICDDDCAADVVIVTLVQSFSSIRYSRFFIPPIRDPPNYYYRAGTSSKTVA
jgi:hypothetical protein